MCGEGDDGVPSVSHGVVRVVARARLVLVPYAEVGDGGVGGVPALLGSGVAQRARAHARHVCHCVYAVAMPPHHLHDSQCWPLVLPGWLCIGVP